MLFQNIVFGPIHSRRLGTSLGINLLPSQYKICNFDCVYCECGFNTRDLSKKYTLPSIHDLVLSLEKFVTSHSKSELRKIDSITFSGNGEPTLHPDFAEICIMLSSFRTEYMPQAKISLLTNSTTTGKLPIRQAVRYLDNVILKLDCGSLQQYKLINRATSLSFDKLVENLIRFGGDCVLQTLLVKSSDPQSGIDNTTQEEFGSYLKIVEKIKPNRIMLYGIDRDTPDQTLIKLHTDELEQYADQLRNLGFNTDIY